MVRFKPRPHRAPLPEELAWLDTRRGGDRPHKRTLLPPPPRRVVIKLRIPGWRVLLTPDPWDDSTTPGHPTAPTHSTTLGHSTAPAHSTAPSSRREGGAFAEMRRMLRKTPKTSYPLSEHARVLSSLRALSTRVPSSLRDARRHARRVARFVTEHESDVRELYPDARGARMMDFYRRLASEDDDRGAGVDGRDRGGVPEEDPPADRGDRGAGVDGREHRGVATDVVCFSAMKMMECTPRRRERP